MKIEGADAQIVLDVLEEIANFAPGPAGKLAAETLVKIGAWSSGVDVGERAHPLEQYLATGAYVPSHDPPGQDDIHSIVAAIQAGLLTVTGVS